jgi:hypothetical protein
MTITLPDADEMMRRLVVNPEDPYQHKFYPLLWGIAGKDVSPADLTTTMMMAASLFTAGMSPIVIKVLYAGMPGMIERLVQDVPFTAEAKRLLADLKK